jgi:heme-degrading monooxygenase HmoA
MVLTVFRSRLRPENEAEFQELAARMMKLAEAMPGFISYKLYVSSDGERCSLVEFETPEQLRAWRELPPHREAQRIGRERYYAEYSLRVFDEPLRESRFTHQGARPEGMA